MSNALVKLDNKMKVGDEEGCRNLLKMCYKQIMNTLPKHIPEGVFTNAILNSHRRNELAVQKGQAKRRLSECTAISMLSAIFCCAETGLMPDTSLQECHIIPFGDQATFMPGYRGLVKLVRQSGEISRVATDIVCVGEKFYYQRGTDPRIDHVPAAGNRDIYNITHAYAIAWYRDKDAGYDFEVMDKGVLDKIRNSAAGKNSPAWTNWEEEQHRKSPLKRLLKMMPMSPVVALAVEQDNRAETGEAQELHAEVQELVGAAINARKPATQRLTDDLKKQNGSGQEPQAETVEAPEKEVLIKEVLLMATEAEPVIRTKVLEKCTEENLRAMEIEAIGVIREEILEDMKKADEKAVG